MMKDLKKIQKIIATKRSIFFLLIFFLISSYVVGIIYNIQLNNDLKRKLYYETSSPGKIPYLNEEGKKAIGELSIYISEIHNKNLEMTCFSWIPYRSYLFYIKKLNYENFVNGVIYEASEEASTDLWCITPFEKIENAEEFKNAVKENLLKDAEKCYKKPSFEYIDSITPGIIDEKLVYNFWIEIQSNLEKHMKEGEYIKAFVDYKILENLDQRLKPQKEKREPSVDYIRHFIEDLKISLPLCISAWLFYLIYKIRNFDNEEGNKNG